MSLKSEVQALMQQGYDLNELYEYFPDRSQDTIRKTRNRILFRDKQKDVPMSRPVPEKIIPIQKPTSKKKYKSPKIMIEPMDIAAMFGILRDWGKTHKKHLKAGKTVQYTYRRAARLLIKLKQEVH